MDLQEIVNFIIDHPKCTVSQLSEHFNIKAGAMSTIMSNLSSRPDVKFKKEETLSPNNRKTFAYTYLSGVIDPEAKSTYAQTILERKAKAKELAAANRLARKEAKKNGIKLDVAPKAIIKSMPAADDADDAEQIDVNSLSPDFFRKSNEPSVVYKKSKKAKITLAAIAEKKVAEKKVAKKAAPAKKAVAKATEIVVSADVHGANQVAVDAPALVEAVPTVIDAKQEFAATVEQASTALSTQFNEHAISNSQNIAIMMEIMKNLSVTANNLSQAFLADLQNPKVVKLSNQIAEVKQAVQSEMQQEVDSIRDASAIAASAKPSASAIKALKTVTPKIVVNKPVDGNRLNKAVAEKPARVAKLKAPQELDAPATDLGGGTEVITSVKAAASSAKQAKKDVIVFGCANTWRKNLHDELRKDFNLVFVESTSQLIDQYGVMGKQGAEVAILVNMLPNEEVIKGKLKEAKIPFTALTGTAYSLQKHLKKQIGVI